MSDYQRFNDGQFLRRCRYGGYCNYLDPTTRMGSLEEWLEGYLPFYMMMPLWSVPYLIYMQGTMIRDILFSPALELPKILMRPWGVIYQFRQSIQLYMSLNNDILELFVTMVLPFAMLAI